MSAVPSLVLTSPERARVAEIERLGAGGDASVALLIERLTDPSWAVRRFVVDALSKQGKAGACALLDVIQHRRDNEARLAAAVDALVLMEAQPDFSIDELLASAAEDPNTAVVADIVQVLGRRKSTDSLPLLVRMTKHGDDNVAVWAIDALGRLGGRRAMEALIETVGTGNFFRTFPAIDVLGRSADPRAVQPLAKLLSSANYLPEAARALGRTGEKSALFPLLELLKSSSDSVLRVAATSVWELRERYAEKSGGDPLVIDELIRAKFPSESVARLARMIATADASDAATVCRLLGLAGKSEAVDLLTAALDGPKAVAESAAEALVRIGKHSRGDGDARLLESIKHGPSARRRILLPLINHAQAATDIALCLTDADLEVRCEACETLTRIGGSGAVAQIFPLLSDPSPRVVLAATAAIQALGTREARSLAVETARSTNPVARRAAMRILGYFGDESAVQPLLDGLSDADPRVREAALQGLPYLEDPRALEALFTESKSAVARVRGLAARALGQLPNADERVYARLLKSLADPDAWVRYYACQSLGRLEYSAASHDVALLMRDEAGQVRVAAVEALSRLSSPEAYRALRDAATSADADVRRAALVGLGITRRLEDLPVLLAAVKDPEAPTRLIALSSLAGYASPALLPALSGAAEDSDEQVRAATIGFLAARPEQEATAILVSLLAKETTRERAREALLVPVQSRVAGLLAALDAADDELAPVLVSLLLRLQRPDAKRALVSAMQLGNVAARRATATVLGSLREPAMLKALGEAAAHDPDPGVRKISSLLLKD